MTNEELNTEIESELSELEKIVFRAVGEASMCWHNKPPASQFDDQKAIDVAHKLIHDIQELYHL